MLTGTVHSHTGKPQYADRPGMVIHMFVVLLFCKKDTSKKTGQRVLDKCVSRRYAGSSSWLGADQRNGWTH